MITSTKTLFSLQPLVTESVSISLSNDNSANFSGEKKYHEELRDVYFLTVREKTWNQISYS